MWISCYTVCPACKMEELIDSANIYVGYCVNQCFITVTRHLR